MFSSLLTGLLATLPAGAEPVAGADLLRQAETAFRTGVEVRDDPVQARRQFRQAASLYEQLRQHGASNADLYRNQGNAYFLAGDLPRAILAYRRGLRVAPNDHALQASLAHARDQVAYPADGGLGRQPVESWPPWLPRPTAGVLLGLTGFLYSLGCLSLTRWRMTRRDGLRLLGRYTLGAALVTATGWGYLVWQARQETHRPLVVVARAKVTLLKGNGADYPPSQDTPVPRGVEARQLFVRGGWLQIQLAGGEVGWVPRAAVVRDD